MCVCVCVYTDEEMKFVFCHGFFFKNNSEISSSKLTNLSNVKRIRFNSFFLLFLSFHCTHTHTYMRIHNQSAFYGKTVTEKYKKNVLFQSFHSEWNGKKNYFEFVFAKNGMMTTFDNQSNEHDRNCFGKMKKKK